MGDLRQDKFGEITFKYDLEYIFTEKVPISVSMLLREENYTEDIAKSFFSGLLPDENSRRKLEGYLGVSEENSLSLLEIIGGE